MAEARWRVGHSGQATNLLAKCVDLELSPRALAKWHELRGLVFREEGRAREAISELHEASRIAGETKDFYRLSSSQILLFGALLDAQGPSSCESMAVEVRQNVIKSGDTFLFGCLHARFAEFEAKRGNLARAFRHLEAGFQFLRRSQTPGFWVFCGLFARPQKLLGAQYRRRFGVLDAVAMQLKSLVTSGCAFRRSPISPT